MGDKSNPEIQIKSDSITSSREETDLGTVPTTAQLDLKVYSGINKNLENQIDAFAVHVLGTNMVKNAVDDLNRAQVGHIRLFSKNGLKNYYAYSDIRYPKNKPSPLL